jgi:hypothetical protein
VRGRKEGRMGEKMIDERRFYRVQERDKEEKKRKREGRGEEKKKTTMGE